MEIAGTSGYSTNDFVADVTSGSGSYLENLIAQNPNPSKQQKQMQDDVQPSFTLCTPVIDADDLKKAKKKKKKSASKQSVRNSSSATSWSAERRKKRKHHRSKQHRRSKISGKKRCKSKLCVKHAKTVSKSNLLCDDDSPCENKLCAKHAKPGNECVRNLVLVLDRPCINDHSSTHVQEVTENKEACSDEQKAPTIKISESRTCQTCINRKIHRTPEKTSERRPRRESSLSSLERRRPRSESSLSSLERRRSRSRSYRELTQRKRHRTKSSWKSPKRKRSSSESSGMSSERKKQRYESPPKSPERKRSSSESSGMSSEGKKQRYESPPKSPERKRSSSAPPRSKWREKLKKSSKSSYDTDSSSCSTSSVSDDYDDGYCSVEKSNDSAANKKIVKVPRSRKRSNTIISRILGFLGLKRRRTSQKNQKSTRVSPSDRNGRVQASPSSTPIKRRQEERQIPVLSNTSLKDNTQQLGSNSVVSVELPQASEPCGNGNCGCPYCPLKVSSELDLDNIFVTEECGNLISESIRNTLCKEIESRLQGLEENVIEEERQFWAAYIPRDKCPRCCFRQQCDLHGSLGCVSCVCRTAQKNANAKIR